jgi:aromatic ring-cleaving dioxygenase
MGPGMMWQGNQGYNQQQTSQRITIDQAIQAAQGYATQVGTNLTVAEVMEFQNNFYALVTEKDTSRGAFELLIDPYTGAVSREIGPDMMWNIKYGYMRTSNSTDNTVTLEQAQADAQKALDAQVPGAKLETDGYSFYGYYTFDYQVNSQIAGMLSVNGFDGQVWFHTWHGSFIAEKEVGK